MVDKAGNSLENEKSRNETERLLKEGKRAPPEVELHCRNRSENTKCKIEVGVEEGNSCHAL